MNGDILEVSDLTVSYGDMTVLRDVNMTVGEGGVVSVVGANGAGKTTLLKTIVGAKAPDSGSIRFKDEDAVGRKPHELIERGLTYVPERHTIFPEMTVLDNLRTALVPAENSGPDPLEEVFDLFPILDERRGQQAGTMSGGQQQMLAIAQGLVVDPDLIMLDEPTLGLAPKIIEDVRDTIEEISNEGVTVLLVDEKIQLSKEVADELYLMRKNTLQYLGSRGEFEDEYDRILQQTID
ncbi:ABC transporter ATP-binding protein [Natrinema soli]|uniref:ABC transporter ATP-binding protein n=1 Tax=Natrinema soli TaxID=1930624 RepID=A0ABD5STN0_9EURY|nr:ATP-binding cassette domain-containing protein [Natrinema soli]